MVSHEVENTYCGKAIMIEESNNKSLRILVVDDDVQIRDSLSQLLTLSGYEVTVASNGTIARLLFEREPFDLVITDILMPSENGLALILNLKDFDADVKIIAISGGGKTNNRGFLEIAKTLGATQALQKPITGDTLLNTIQQVLSGL